MNTEENRKADRDGKITIPYIDSPGFIGRYDLTGILSPLALPPEHITASDYNLISGYYGGRFGNIPDNEIK